MVTVVVQEKPELRKLCFIICPTGHVSASTKKRAVEVYRDYIESACKETGCFPVHSGPELGANRIKGITNALSCAPMAIAYMGSEPWNADVMTEVGYRLSTKLPLVYLCDQDEHGDNPELPILFESSWIVSLPPSGF
ncbi:MAG TPA: hypothetical protein VJY33_09360, partial [Isosphaeraceae bacterium]|nr:hypothetical protein [Isosphaeraceae bacterium]